MSSNYPPQLQLRLPPSTTSFKRTFEEFGFDLASPGIDSESGNGSSSSGSSNGNERNKRPRSASSTLSINDGSPGTASQSSSHSRLTSIVTASSSASVGFAQATTATTRLPPPSALSVTRPTASAASGASLVGEVGQNTRSFHDIPALPTPNTIQDIDMLNFFSSGTTDNASSQTSNSQSQQYTPSAQTRVSSTTSSPALPASVIASPSIPAQLSPPPPLASSSSSPPVTQTSDHLRLSMGRFSTFNAEIAALRRSQSLSPLAPHTITPPPTLPPLTLSDDQPDLSEATLPYLHPERRTDATLPQSLDARGRRTDASTRDEVISRSADAVPFEPDLRIDPRMPSAPHRSDTTLLSTQTSPIQPSADSVWPQYHTQTTTSPTGTDPTMAVTAMRNRLDSALEPLRSASPLVPELTEPRPPLPTRQSRTAAPTLPPLRTQLQNTNAWDELSPYRMLFFGPSGSIANNVVQESSMREDRPAHDNTNLNSSRASPQTFWEGGIYPFTPSNPPPPPPPPLAFANSNNNRDRESVSQDPRGPSTLISASQPPVEADNPFPSNAQPLPPLPHPAIIFDDLDIATHPSLEEQSPPPPPPPPPSSSRNHPQQPLSSSSSESLARSSLEGYLSSEEWLPALRRRSAWRLLDSDEEERVPIDTRRFRFMAERREAAAAAAARAGRQDAGSLLEPPEPRAWIDIEAERRSAAANRQPDPLLRSNPAPAERYAGPERTRFWDDAGDRVPGGVIEYDNWLRSESRTDLSQRLERLADLDYDAARPSLSRSNTSTSTLGALNRFRNRFYHSSSTRFGSSNSLVTENSSEFRRRGARQEWLDRLSRLNEGRNQSQADSRQPRSTLPDMAIDETRRPGLGTPTRLYGSIDGLDEPRHSDPFSFEGDHVYEPSFPSHRRRVASLSRAPALPSSWADHGPRPASPPQSHLSRSNTTSIQPIRDRDEPERFSRFLDYIHDYRDSSLYVPPPFDFSVPSASPPRVSAESLPGHRTRNETHSESWFSRRRHLSTRSSSHQHGVHSETWIDLAAEYAAERSPTESSRAPVAGGGFGSRVGSTRQGDRDHSFAELRASYERNPTRADESSRLSPLSPIGSYLIDVPSLPSPDLSELFENVPHFPQSAPHEERFVGARPDIPPRLFPRRRSPSPVPPPLPPVSAVPARLQARARAAERQSPSTGRATSFEHIDPELFAPGPYRNTIQSLMRRRDASPPPPSRPPTIPPFAFESGPEREGIPPPPPRRYRHLFPDSFDSRDHHHHHIHHPPPLPRAAESSEEPPIPPGSFWRQREAGRRPALYVRNDWEHGHGPGTSQLTTAPEDRYRPPAAAGSNNSELHAFLTRHVRLDGARMDRIAEAAAAQMNEASSNGNAARFHHAIEVLRDGGLSRRHHQNSERPSGPRSSGDTPRERSPAEWYVPRRRIRARRVRPLGDYMRDEDFDESYESLLSLAAAIGDAKPRSTPEDVISKLETATYKDWVTTDSDKRCPICLDDYAAGDPVMKAGTCSHWLHKDCLHQWLKGANTCPVCRMTVHTSPRIRHTHTRGPRQPRNQPSTTTSSSTPASLHVDNSHNNNIRNNNLHERQDEPMIITQQLDTTNSQSNNTEPPPPSSPFSARTRAFNGWSGWRYYHP